MANVALILLFFIFPLSAHSSSSGTEIADIQSWLNQEGQKYYKPGSGDQWVRNSSPNGDRFIKVTSGFDYNASNGRTYPVSVDKEAQIDASKIGKAAVKLAKAVTPLSVGFAFYDVVCELSDICKKADADAWEKQVDNYVRQPDDTSYSCSMPKGESYVQRSGLIYQIQHVKSWAHCGGTDYGAQGYNMAAGYCFNDPKYENCSWTVVMSKQVSSFPSSTNAPVSDSDWTTAETKLNDPRFDVPLLQNGQPVPMSTIPTLTPPAPVKISEEETVTRDDQGNVTGTQRKTTTLSITDSATESRPGSVTGNEITTITNYNTSNVITSTTTIDNSSPPPEKPNKITVNFDSVPDTVLPTQDLDVDLNTNSWGEGACPAPITVSTTLKEFTIPTQQYCDFATASRPFVLLIAGITGIFIITGFTRGQS